ncbi:MAG: DNA repair protein RecN, partial [Pseudomonadota bacterium]
SISTLSEFTERLINIHGQQANQALLRRAEQRRTLDALGELATTTGAVRSAWSAWRDAAQSLASLEEDHGALSDADLELLAYQVSELDALAVEDGELETLEGELRRLGAAGELISAVESALVALGEEQAGADDRLAAATRSLGAVAGLDQRLADVLGTLEEAAIALGEASNSLERYLGDVDLDPERLTFVEQRLASVDEVARKHRIRAAQIRPLHQRLRDRLAASRDLEGSLARARAQVAKTDAAYRKAAKALSAARSRAALDVAETAEEIIRSLGLANAVFSIRVHHHADAPPAAHGLDEVSFEISTNPGQPPGPLEKVASGGELSRIALALEVVAADSTVVPCFVFDEVDTGVGGGVAEMVGRRLRQLGSSHQVLCVTHLPQVASQAHHHLRVSKQTDGKRTATTLEPLGADAAVDELARMLGGMEITATTREHAREMRARAHQQP